MKKILFLKWKTKLKVIVKLEYIAFQILNEHFSLV